MIVKIARGNLPKRRSFDVIFYLLNLIITFEVYLSRLSPIASSSNAATTELNSPSLIPYQSEHETPSPQLPVNNNNAVHYNNSTTRQRVSSLGPSPHIMSSGPVPMPTLTPVQCNSALGGITVQRHVASVSANNPFPCSTPQSTCNNTPVAVTQLQSLTSALPPSLPSAAKTLVN